MIKDLTLLEMHILIVEDNYFIASALFDDFEDLGAVPLGPYPSVTEALNYIFNEGRIDVAVLDFNLIEEASSPMADELQRHGIPFIFVTGNGETVKILFPNAPIHLKPADMAAVALTLVAVVADRASRTNLPPFN